MHETRISRNRMNVIYNDYQGKHKKILTVCSAGCLRSPTAAHILAGDPFNFNTRCCGTTVEYAIVPLNGGLVMWADEIVVMDEDQAAIVNSIQSKLYEDYVGFIFRAVHILDIEDNYAYRDPKLVKIMTDKFFKIFQADLRIENE